jgi:hypothetical protein
VGSVPLRLSSGQAFAHTRRQVNRRVSSEYGGSGLGGFQSNPPNSPVTNIGTSCRPQHLPRARSSTEW